MQIKNATIESFLKSLAFSLLLGFFWGGLTVFRARYLLGEFGLIELLWLVNNVTISLLFVVRTRPVVVSMNPVHWVVALVSCFLGFFFSKGVTASNPSILLVADVLLVSSLAFAIATALVLRRSYDFLPALRKVKTGAANRSPNTPSSLPSSCCWYRAGQLSLRKVKKQ